MFITHFQWPQKNSYEWWCVNSNIVKEWRYVRELVIQCSFIDLIMLSVAEDCSVEWIEQDEEGNHPYETWGSNSGICPQGLRQATESSVRAASLQAEFHPRPGVLPIWLSWGSNSGICPKGLKQDTESPVRAASLQAEFHPRPGVLPIWLSWGSNFGICLQGLRHATESSVRAASLQAEFHPRPGVLPIWLCCLMFSDISDLEGRCFLW